MRAWALEQLLSTSTGNVDDRLIGDNLFEDRLNCCYFHQLFVLRHFLHVLECVDQCQLLIAMVVVQPMSELERCRKALEKFGQFTRRWIG